MKQGEVFIPSHRRHSRSHDRTHNGQSTNQNRGQEEQQHLAAETSDMEIDDD